MICLVLEAKRKKAKQSMASPVMPMNGLTIDKGDVGLFATKPIRVIVRAIM